MSPPSLAQFRSQKPSFGLGCQFSPSRKYKQHIVQEYKKKTSRHDDYGRNSNFASIGKANCQECQLKEKLYAELMPLLLAGKYLFIDRVEAG